MATVLQQTRTAEELEDRVFLAHEYQAKALVSKARYVILVSGIQGGKTICGAHWLWIQLNRFPRDHHLVGFPTYRIFEQSTWPALEKVLVGMGTMNWRAFQRRAARALCLQGARLADPLLPDRTEARPRLSIIEPPVNPGPVTSRVETPLRE